MLASDVAAALGRCQRGAAFYEADHPAAVHQRRELELAVQAWHAQARGDTFIAAAGDGLLLTGLDQGIADESCKALAHALITRSVVGIKLKVPTTRHDLDELVACLGESDKRVRAAGGVTKVLAERNVKSVEIFEMDLDKLMAGGPVDNTGLDPLLAKALSEILLLKQRDNRRGAAIELTLEKVTSPSSLGSLLDELIDGAAPGVADQPPIKSRAQTALSKTSLVGATADDLAEICTEAFGKVTGGENKNPEALAEAANVLSSALVRLSPKARFKLLEKLAAPGTDDDGVAAVGRAVPNEIVLSAVAQAVMGEARDSQLAISIGNLLERLRPVERERQQLLDQLDDSARQAGRPLEGLFLQELNELSQQQSFGTLDLPIRETRDGLTQIAKLRQTTGGQPEIVMRTFSTLRPENKFFRSARLLCGMLQQERAVAAPTLAAVRGLLDAVAVDPSLQSAGGAIILALWSRAIRDGPNSAAAQQLMEVALSRSGPDWCVELLRQLRGKSGADHATLLGDFVKAVLSIHTGETFRRALADGLQGLDRSVLRVIERRVAEFSPLGAATLIARAGRDSPVAAVALTQAALRSPSADVKEAAVRVLAAFPAEDTFAFLRRLTGLDGDDKAVQALHAQKLPETLVLKLMRTAVDALGASRAPGAVPVLQELLLRTRVIGGAGFDKMRGPVARALSVNSTPAARAVLDEGKRSKNRAIRLACGGHS